VIVSAVAAVVMLVGAIVVGGGLTGTLTTDVLADALVTVKVSVNAQWSGLRSLCPGWEHRRGCRSVPALAGSLKLTMPPR
jgi:hypothetical protein